jgi:hypothetical protein
MVEAMRRVAIAVLLVAGTYLARKPLGRLLTRLTGTWVGTRSA